MEGKYRKIKNDFLIDIVKKKSPNKGIHDTNNYENDGAVGVLRQKIMKKMKMKLSKLR